MTAERHLHGHRKGAESEGYPRPHGEGQWRRNGEEPDEDHKMMCASRRQIEKVGDRVVGPYVPLGAKRKGEGDTGGSKDYEQSLLTLVTSI